MLRGLLFSAVLLLPMSTGMAPVTQDIGGIFSDRSGANIASHGSEFVFARLVYGSGFGGRGRRGGGGSWRTDYPEADVKFMFGIERLSNIRIDLDARVTVAPMDPELFDYPLLYAVEVGSWYFDQEEAARMREYLERGGFLVVDDFWGTREWGDFYGQLTKIFPDREVEEVPMDHPILHSFYDIDQIVQVPNITNGRRGGRTDEGDNSEIPYALAIFDDDRRPMVMINYNTDLGDAWEWADDPGYPHFFSGFAYRMGINFIVYSMTH